MKITKDENDALGRRIEKKDLVDADNTTRYYYNDRWQDNDSSICKSGG